MKQRRNISQEMDRIDQEMSAEQKDLKWALSGGWSRFEHVEVTRQGWPEENGKSQALGKAWVGSDLAEEGAVT